MNNENDNVSNQVSNNNQNINHVNNTEQQIKTQINDNIAQSQNYKMPNYQNTNSNSFVQPIINERKRKNKSLLFTIIGALTLGIILAIVLVISSQKKDYTRTIMIYMVGSNLESDSGLATVDLNEIDYSVMDNKNVNVILIAGGSKKWNNNYIDINETSIYELKEFGFEKVKSQSQANMGSPEVLSDFLTYVYNNYKTDKYTLLFWNHGAAIYGSEFDELNNDDNLTVKEWKQAFNNSPFNNKNKLEMIIFNTCLNGTLEVADSFIDYSDYLVASEETTIGYKLEGDLKFINEIKTSDSSYDVALKFINAYKNKIKNYKELYSYVSGNESDLYSTYSIIDLSKIKQLEKAVNEFFESIDIPKNYNTVAKIRSNLYQYAYEQTNEASYDMVDLYNLVDGIKSISPTTADKVLKNIDEAVLYNWATNSESRGISIYFPYNGENKHKEYFLNVYNNFSSLRGYHNFINKFYEAQTSSHNTYSYSKNDVNININNQEADFTLKLSNEQKEVFARANYIVFRDNKDGYFLPVYRGKEVSLSGNTLSANIKDRQLKVISNEDGTENILTLFEISNTDQYIKYSTVGILEDFSKENMSEWKEDSATILLVYDKNNKTIKISSAIINDNGEYKPDSVAVDLNDYTSIMFGSSKYKILDDNGNYNENWESNGVFEGFEENIKKIEFKLQSFDDGYDYYAVFIIWDTNNNSYYSKLVKMN